jgi:hypothetical protein
LGQFCELRVANWAAILVSDIDGNQESLGLAVDEDAIPSAVRRRMGRLERLAVRCAFGVLDARPTGQMIFCSRYGNVETLASLLRGIADEQLMSPMAFSGSVHNAAPGLIGQIRKERIGHTALAAGSHTFAAGLIEAYAQLALEECEDVTLIFADMALPEFYREYEEEDAPGLAMAIRLERAEEDSRQHPLTVQPGRRGALEVLDRLKSGPVRLGLGEGLAWSMS